MSVCEGLSMEDKQEAMRPDWLCTNCKARHSALEKFLGDLFVTTRKELLASGSQDNQQRMVQDLDVTDSQLMAVVETETDNLDHTERTEETRIDKLKETTSHNKALITRLQKVKNDSDEREAKHRGIEKEYNEQVVTLTASIVDIGPVL
jgi:SMC interacting uncharacterized protein involved in chromosome segregation